MRGFLGWYLIYLALTIPATLLIGLALASWWTVIPAAALSVAGLWLSGPIQRKVWP